MREDSQTMDNASRTVLMIGAAFMAGGLLDGAAFAQAPAAPAAAPAAPAAVAAPAIPAALYPTPEFPTCIVKAPTDCRTADGHPDLSGLWNGAGPTFGNGGGALASGAAEQDFAGRGNSFVGFEADGGLFRETQQGVGNGQPQYKPEYWDQIIDNEYNGNFEDPVQDCLPNGVPRVGAPTAIMSLANQPWVVLVYNSTDTFGLKLRMVPTDGRPHNVTNVASETWDGDPVGHWEGDTLVIETVGFTDSSWLAKGGFIHGFNMKVTEKITRTGNNMTWQATVDDPDYFVKPWTEDPVMRALVTDPNATAYEALPCEDIDHLHVTSHVRSG
jgi:hypothetical protein